MKNNSTDTAPKGRIPPRRQVMTGCIYHSCLGTARGIKLVRTGNAIASLLYPKNDPKNTKGTETQNQRKKRVKKVPNGRAPEDPSAHRARFSMKATPNMTPGYRKAVKRVLFLHSVPLNILYSLDEEYPANEPINTNNRIKPVVRDPLFVGDNKPNKANTNVARNMRHN